MREPWFWRNHSLAAQAMTAALQPAAIVYQTAHRLRWRFTRAKHADVPVICVGNATLGGAGKTPFAILAAALLQEEGLRIAFLTRGYGGDLRGPVLVDVNRHTADEVGDEALLLARHGDVIASRDRPAGATLAVKHGAQVIIMDDGFQNPTLHKDLCVLIVGADEQASNGALFPAGPFRESPASARARAQLVVAMGASDANADFHAQLAPQSAPTPQRVVAFAGIGTPQKFFDTLETCGFDIAARVPFPDHHRFSAAELRVLSEAASNAQARLICTEKDFVRLPAAFQKEVLTLSVAMQVADRARLKQCLFSAIKLSMPASENHRDD